MIGKQIQKYYYNPSTGEFVASSNNDMIKFDYPYIQRETFPFSDYRVDLETLELIYEPKPRNTRA